MRWEYTPREPFARQKREWSSGSAATVCDNAREATTISRPCYSRVLSRLLDFAKCFPGTLATVDMMILVIQWEKIVEKFHESRPPFISKKKGGLTCGATGQ